MKTVLITEPIHPDGLVILEAAPGIEIIHGKGLSADEMAAAVTKANAIGTRTYPLTASFRSVEGISVGSDVRLAGVKVGTITSLKLNPQTYFADAEIALDQTVLLPEDSAILISSEGLLGGNFVELVPGGAEEILAPGAEIEDTQGSVSLLTLLMKWVGGGSDEAGAAP